MIDIAGSKDKTFEVQIITKNHTFVFRCLTAYEALEAVLDAAKAFGFKIDDTDSLMNTLIEMKNGRLISTETARWGIKVI